MINRCVYKGTDIYNFEQEFAKYIGVKYAICFSSARYSLFLIYTFFNCKNKKVVFPAYTCIPALDAVRWAGAKPHFTDVDLNSYNPVFDRSFFSLDGIGAITLSYLYGLVGDIEQFLQFGKKRGIPIIEDAAIALGATFKGTKVGSLGDAAVFSLQSSKIITAWKGGIITTNNEELYTFLSNERKKLPYPSIGKLLFNILLTYFRRLLSNPMLYSLTMYPIKKVVSSWMFNKFMKYIVDQDLTEAITGRSVKEVPKAEKTQFTNAQASFAFSSFKKIELLLNLRRSYAQLLSEKLKKYPTIQIPSENHKIQHAYGRYPIRIAGLSKFDLQKIFLRFGIEVSLYYPYICPNTRFMKQYAFNNRDYPNAFIASRETILLPFHTFLRKRDLFFIIEAINKIIKEKGITQ